MGYYSYPKGDCVCHFRVSEEQISHLQTQRCLYADEAQREQKIRDVG
jgi:hypothetical protein